MKSNKTKTHLRYLFLFLVCFVSLIGCKEDTVSTIKSGAGGGGEGDTSETSYPKTEKPSGPYSPYSPEKDPPKITKPDWDSVTLTGNWIVLQKKLGTEIKTDYSKTDRDDQSIILRFETFPEKKVHIFQLALDRIIASRPFTYVRGDEVMKGGNFFEKDGLLTFTGSPEKEDVEYNVEYLSKATLHLTHKQRGHTYLTRRLSDYQLRSILRKNRISTSVLHFR